MQSNLNVTETKPLAHEEKGAQSAIVKTVPKNRRVAFYRCNYKLKSLILEEYRSREIYFIGKRSK